MKRFNAKLKNETHVTIFSADADLMKMSFYAAPIIEHEIEYGHEIKLASDEWFFVSLSDEQVVSMIDEYKITISESWETNPITRAHYREIDVCYMIDGDSIIFTKVTKGRVISNTKFLCFSDLWPEIQQHWDAIEFNGQKDVFFNGGNKLYFKSFSRAKSIFEWLADFYRTADSDEIETFLWSEFFDVKEDFRKEKIWERLRKNIADVIDRRSINFSDSVVRGKYQSYAQEFLWSQVSIGEEWKFAIEKNEDLTSVLKLLQWHYYLDYMDPERKMETNHCRELN